MAMHYEFLPIEACNLCGEPTRTAKVLGRRMSGSQGLRPTQRVGISTTVMKCRRCELVFANPLPIPVDMAQHYGVPPESYWKESYFQLEPSYFSAQIARYAVLGGNLTSGVALDIGAGVGKCMRALEAAGMQAYGLEPSRPFYERALSRMGLEPARLQHAAIEEATYDADRFDFVTFGAVLEHLYDPSASLERALRWTKPGGLVHIEVPSSRWLTSRLVNLAYKLQGLDYVANISPMHTPFHLYEFTLRSFELHSRTRGYSIAHHEHAVCNTYLPKVLDPLLKPVMKATDTGMQLEVWLRKAR